ncbi:MAG: efflux RND transporter permease subunit, partial [Planctomycetaceae bacterium]
LDYNGQEAVGGIVVMRYRENPRAVIQRVLAKIADLERDLGGIRIRPVYDRTQLIDETVQTLTQSIAQETMITIVVTVLFLLHFRASLVIAVTLPLAVLLAWIGMRVFGVDANIMSLAGIAIAVGSMVDMAIIILENIYAGLSEWEQQGSPGGSRRRLLVIREAAAEVAPAVMTAVGTTIISFLPVFFLTGRDYRLFAPLAWTKTYALVASLVVAVAVVPMLCRVLLRSSRMSLRASLLLGVLSGAVGAGATLTGLLEEVRLGLGCGDLVFATGSGVVSAVLMFLLSRERIRPIEENPVSRLLRWVYGGRLRFALRYKLLVLSVPAVVLVLGAGAWFGLGRVLRPVEHLAALVGADLRSLPGYQRACEVLPGLESDDWIALDEGSWFYMPSLYPAASFSQAMEVLQSQNALIREIPEVEHVLGKIGRAQTALDPAPASMIETYVMLKPRAQWRAGMTERGIWDAVNAVATLPGVTPASALQPIEGRVVMLQAGIKAAMAVRIYGDSLEGLSAAALATADRLKRHPLVNAQTVAPDIVLGKPYLEFDVDRAEAARYGMTTKMVNEIISAGLGGVDAAMTVEGRERYPVQVRFSRDVRESLSELPLVPVVTETGEVVPLQRLASVRTTWGPGMISSEDSRLVAHVMFSPAGLTGDLETVEAVMSDLSGARQSGELKFPEGNFELQSVGSFQSQLEANQRLMWIIPLVAGINFLLIYLEFRDLPVTLAVFTGLPVSFAGGMLMVGLAGVQLNTAVWIGFIATLGLAEDDGVVMATFIRQLLGRRKIDSVQQLRATVLEAGMKRIRPCMMTTATTLIALIPVLTATGRGAEVARAMAWPVLGGMLVEPFASFIVPVMYCGFLELRLLAGFGVADSAECESLPIMPELPCGSVG